MSLGLWLIIIAVVLLIIAAILYFWARDRSWAIVLLVIAIFLFLIGVLFAILAGVKSGQQRLLSNPTIQSAVAATTGIPPQVLATAASA